MIWSSAKAEKSPDLATSTVSVELFGINRALLGVKRRECGNYRENGHELHESTCLT
jgi:hypothetical protein